MAGKFGGQSVLFLVDGYSLIANKLKGLRYKHLARQQDSTGLGDTYQEFTPTGMNGLELAQDGAFFDTDENRIHTAMAAAPPTSPQTSVRIACLGFEGDVLGNGFVGFQGNYTETYDVVAQLNELTRANVVHRLTGQIDHGIILHPLAAHTEDFNGSTYDGSAASTGGGIGYLQITSQFGAFTGRIEDSADGISWQTLLTFTTVSAAPNAQRATVSGTVRRYLRFCGVVWGTVSPSASVSPSSSISPSASTSISPSSSLSPSVSASASASASLSPSASTSLSPSASTSPSSSLSPSVSASASASPSRSPSASTSPSVSASASVSPSAESGVQGNVTVFAGFRRL